MINVTFDDGVRELPSTLKIKCNATGAIKSFYTPYLVKLIKRKYNNSYQYFIDNYVCRGANKKIKDEDDVPTYKAYKLALASEYRYLKSHGTTSRDKHRLTTIADIFESRFPDDDIASLDF